jgi:hypothetical protein
MACSNLAKGISHDYDEIYAPSDPWRTQYCPGSATDYCDRCMRWMTPLACTGKK